MNAKSCRPKNWLFATMLVTANGLAQGTFQNLGFENAVIIPVSGDQYGRVQFAPALPGWTGSNGPTVESLALYNNQFLGSTGLGIQGPGSALPRIEGSYTAMLQSGLDLGNPQIPTTASLSQSGLIPIGTMSLRFKAIADGPFQVSLNDVPISLQPIETVSGIVYYGADLSAFAGNQTKLTFTIFHKEPPLPRYSILFLDSIQFSDQPIVPEPGAGTIFLLGLAALAFSKSRRTK